MSGSGSCRSGREIFEVTCRHGMYRARPHGYAPQRQRPTAVDGTTVVETFTSADTLTGDESARYGEFFNQLMAQAIGGDEALRLLTAAAVRLARHG